MGDAEAFEERWDIKIINLKIKKKKQTIQRRFRIHVSTWVYESDEKYIFMLNVNFVW